MAQASALPSTVYIDAISMPARDHRRFYNRIAGTYDALAHTSERRARQDALEALAIQPGERVLEIGFGTGHALVDLSRQVGPAGRVVGLDASSGMAAEATKRLDREDAGAALVLGDGRRTPFLDQVFDAVFLSFTLELFEADGRCDVLAECRRVLAAGGRLGIVAMAQPGPGEADTLIEKGYRWMHRTFPSIVDCQPIDVAKEVQAAGFRLDRLKSDEIWTMPVRAALAVKT